MRAVQTPMIHRQLTSNQRITKRIRLQAPNLAASFSRDYSRSVAQPVSGTCVHTDRHTSCWGLMHWVRWVQGWGFAFVRGLVHPIPLRAIPWLHRIWHCTVMMIAALQTREAPVRWLLLLWLGLRVQGLLRVCWWQTWWWWWDGPWADVWIHRSCTDKSAVA